MPRFGKRTVAGGGIALAVVGALLVWWLVPETPTSGTDTVHATTASGPPPRVPDSPPQKPNTRLWTAPLPDRDGMVAVHGAYVVTGQRDGFTVRGLLTGKRR